VGAAVIVLVFAGGTLCPEAITPFSARHARQAALSRLRPDRIILGELRAVEAFTFLRAALYWRPVRGKR